MNQFRALVASAFLLLQAAPPCSLANESRGFMWIAISSQNGLVLNKVNLDQLKRHILAVGKRCTYSNMYNNNPCWELPNFQLYLNPDPGPDGRIQWNINCDVTRGDFNTLVVETKNANSNSVAIEFQNKTTVSMRAPATASPAEIREIKEVLEAAVLAALKAIESGKSSSRTK